MPHSLNTIPDCLPCPALPLCTLQLGDYFASAQLAGAPPPPKDVISRAVGAEGLCCCISGLLGTTTGSSAYAGAQRAQRGHHAQHMRGAASIPSVPAAFVLLAMA